MKHKGSILERNLVLLLSGRVVSDMGSGIQLLIMPLFIIDKGGDAGMIGLFAFLSLMPIIIIYPFGGVIGDRLNRKGILVAADLTSAALVLSLSLFSFLGMMSWEILFGLQILVSSAYGFFDPASKAMVPKLVARDKLGQANSLIATLRLLSGIAAPLTAVLLYTAYGITLLFVINGASFLISGIFESFIRYEHIAQRRPQGFKGVLQDLGSGIEFILHHRLIRNMSVFFLIIFALIQPVFTVVLPVFFRTNLDYIDSRYGMIQVVLFMGAFIGSVLLGFSSRQGELKTPFVIGISAVSVLILIFAVLLYPGIVNRLNKGSLVYLLLFTGILFLLHMAIMFIAIPIQTIVQRCADEKYMSRVFSIFGLITKGGMPLGALLYGLLLNRIPVYATVCLAAVIITVLSVLFLSSETIPMIRDIEEIRRAPVGGQYDL